MRHPVGTAAALTLAAVLWVVLAPSALAGVTSPTTYAGSVPHSGCTYEMSAAWSGAEPTSGTVSGKLECAHGAVNLKVEGSWEGTSAELTQATGTIFGKPVSTGALAKTLEGVTLPTSEPQAMDTFFEQFAGKSLEYLQASLLKSPLTIGPKSFDGGRCIYTLEASWSTSISEGTLKGAVGCGTLAGLKATGTWSETGVKLETAEGEVETVKVPLTNIDTTQAAIDQAPLDLGGLSEGFAGQVLEAVQSSFLKSPLKYSKTFLGGRCRYELEAAWKEKDLEKGTLKGGVSCGSGIAAELHGSWEAGEPPSVNLETVAGSIGPINLPEETIDEAIPLTLDPALELSDFVESFAEEVPEKFSTSVTNSAIGVLANSEASNVLENSGLPSQLLSQLDTACLKGVYEYNDSSASCHHAFTPNPEGAPNPMIKYGPGFASMDDSQAGACPQLSNDPPPDLFVICVPTALAGTFNAGKKTIIIMPGGAIMAAPIGSGAAAPTTPVMETSGSVIALGGAVAGVNLKILAKGDVELAGALVSMLGSLEISAGGKLKIGEADTKEVLGFLPESAGGGLVNHGEEFYGTGANLVWSQLGGAVPETTLLPTQLWAGSLKLNSGEASIGAGSAVSARGLGYPGAYFLAEPVHPPETGTQGHAPPGVSGASDSYGGSHIGYGGFEIDSKAEDEVFGPGPRGASYDSPFAPALAGGGGGGEYDGGEGEPGGGVISIESSSLAMNGVVRANGENGGSASDYERAGGGAGGAIDVKTGALTGVGSFEATGASANPSLGNDIGARGGGGAVALHFTSSSFTGAEDVHGGFSEPSEEGMDVDLGGAGSIFLQPEERAPSAPKVTVSSEGGEGEGESELLARTPAPHETASPPAHRHRRAFAARLGPRLSSLKIVPQSFTAAAGPSLSATAAASSGAAVRYRDSRASTSYFKVLRHAPGVRRGGACVAPPPRKSKVRPRKCSRSISVGTFSHRDHGGVNVLHFTGAVARHALAVGSYTLDGSTLRRGAPQVAFGFRIVATKAVKPPPARPAPGKEPEPVTPPKPGASSEGTLIIDGGSSSWFPATDGTPLPAGWSGPARNLIIRHGARVYATSAEFANITIEDHSTLTAPFGARSLTVRALDELHVDATSRIDMSGRGYAGGRTSPEVAAETAPGATPASGTYGGSHGGVGGNVEGEGQPGSTYDNPAAPSLPGGGGGAAECAGAGIKESGSFGGGVLDVSAATLNLEGEIAADGQNTNAPTPSLPFIWTAKCSAGAGGSIQARASELAGAGSIHANGGSVCLEAGELLSPEGACNSAFSAGGGGGDVLVVAPDHTNFKGSVAAAGGVDHLDGASVAGSAGSVIGP